MSPEQLLEKLGVRRLPPALLPEAFDERNPPPLAEVPLLDYEPYSEGIEPQAEMAVIDGVEKRITTMKSLNARYAILQTLGSASVYVSRPDSRFRTLT